MLAKKILFFSAAFFMSACANASFYAANFPVEKSSLNITEDISYGEKEIQKLDIYSKKDSGDDLPVIIFFYGGGYTNGDKDNYLFVADYFADLGYVVALPDYSKYPQVLFPEFIEDGALASKWVYKNIEKYGGDHQNITLIGHSAGAHIAALLTFDESYEVTDKITKFIGLAGPYSFTPQERKYKKIFSAENADYDMKVDNFVDGNEAPAYLIGGSDDRIVGQRNIDKLESAIKEKNGKVEAIIIKDVDHTDLVSALTKIRSNEKVRGIISDYLKR